MSEAMKVYRVIPALLAVGRIPVVSQRPTEKKEEKEILSIKLFFHFNIIFFFLAGPPQPLGLRFSSGPHRRQGRD
jgi:hypothetical protein